MGRGGERNRWRRLETCSLPGVRPELPETMIQVQYMELRQREPRHQDTRGFSELIFVAVNISRHHQRQSPPTAYRVVSYFGTLMAPFSGGIPPVALG